MSMIISRTPLRIPLGGGGSDLPYYFSKKGGHLITAAIDKYVYIVVKDHFKTEFHITYSKTEIVTTVDDIQHPLIRECLKLLGIYKPIEIISIADIHSGTGMGSSFSFLVGLLHALHAYKKEYVSNKQLAEEATHISLNILKEPAGLQDQYVAAYGGVICMAINIQGRVTVSQLNITQDIINKLNEGILLFYTGITRSANEILSNQKKEAISNKQKMDNMTQIKEIGYEIKKALESGNVRRFGEWLNIHWETKQSLSKDMSTNQINKWYSLAMKNGAIGGKIMGAGGGGFFMFYADTENERKKLREIMKKEKLVELPYKFDFDGTKIIFNQY